MRGQGDSVLFSCHSIFMYRWELSGRDQETSGVEERGANRRTKQEDGQRSVVEGLVLGLGSTPPVVRGRMTECKQVHRCLVSPGAVLCGWLYFLRKIFSWEWGSINRRDAGILRGPWWGGEGSVRSKLQYWDSKLGGSRVRIARRLWMLT